MKRLVLVPLFLAAVGFGVLLWIDSPADGKVVFPERLGAQNPRTTALMEIRKSEARLKKKPYSPVQEWTPLERISPFLQDAVLAAEDDRFYLHHGVEWGSAREAFVENWKAGKPVRGGSTITQQLAKNLYLAPKKTYLRKVRELFYVMRLERALPKKRIFEVYLNVAEWGDGVFGAQAAAQAYFHKDAAALTLEEAVALAAVLPSPRRHKPGDGSKWTAYRVEWVWSQLRTTGRSRNVAAARPVP